MPKQFENLFRLRELAWGSDNQDDFDRFINLGRELIGDSGVFINSILNEDESIYALVFESNDRYSNITISLKPDGSATVRGGNAQNSAAVLERFVEKIHEES